MPKAIPSASTETPRQVKPRRPRSNTVRQRILTLLGHGPASRNELIKRGGFSQASLFLNLKALRAEHLIAEDKATRQLRLVADAAAADTSADKPSAMINVPQTMAVAVGSPELHLALEVVTVRLAPIDQAAEKVHVLQALSRGAPEPVAEILQLLAQDVSRYAAI
jgi:hypothetical protein